MKYLTITIALIILTSFNSSAQDFIVGSKSVTGVFQAQGKSKTAIFTSIYTMLNESSDGAVEEIEMADQAKGLIIVKGKNTVPYRNLGKLLYPKRNGMAEVLDAEFKHRIEISIEDNMYLVTYYITEMERELYSHEDLFFNCINFEEISNEEVQKYNRSMGKFLKSNLVFKNKREVFFENTPSQFLEVSNNLRNNAEVMLYSINQGV